MHHLAHHDMARLQDDPLVPSWTELIWGAIAFLVVFVALSRVLLPRITKVLEERTEKIEGVCSTASD
jgi:F-type H+-transporting ATPase subunit b